MFFKYTYSIPVQYRYNNFITIVIIIIILPLKLCNVLEKLSVILQAFRLAWLAQHVASASRPTTHNLLLCVDKFNLIIVWEYSCLLYTSRCV